MMEPMALDVRLFVKDFDGEEEPPRLLDSTSGDSGTGLMVFKSMVGYGS